jgi:hypothetical protein
MSVGTFPNVNLYEAGYCAILVRGISPQELLSRLPDEKSSLINLDRSELEAIKAFGSDVEEEDVPELDFDELERSGILASDGPLLRAGIHDGWAFVVESEGPYLAKEEILKSASRGTAALSAQLSETAAAWISYAEDGEILSSFDPLFPESDYGKNPATLEALTGYRRAISRGDRAESYENALRQIQGALQCAMPATVDAARLPSVRIAARY